MRKILIVGNPNVGKSTLFNSLTKSNEHTGNFHGVTVSEKSKVINIENEKIELVDLPGMYSLNSFSFEEEVAKNVLLAQDCERVVLVDANSMKRNLYLCLQMMELKINFKIFINNYDYFFKNGNEINSKKLSEKLGVDCQIINAKKIKSSLELFERKNNNYYLPYLSKYINKIKEKYNLGEQKIILALNGDFSNLEIDQKNYIKAFLPNLIKDRYNYLNNIISTSINVKNNYIYGLNKSDKIVLNPIIMLLGFLITFFVGIYLIFFLIGPFLSGVFETILTRFLFVPIINLLCGITDNVWLIEFFENAVFGGVLTIISFVPQVCLLFAFLTLLEDSGLIARMAFVFDDFLSFFGLNGKAVYLMLLGLGCNTMSSMASRNMPEKNLRVKTAILNPYISCFARLPVFVLIASVFFLKFSFWVVCGLYLLGLLVLLFMSFILNKTILKTERAGLLIEFPPLRKIDIKHVLKEAEKNGLDLVKRIFTIVLSVGIIVWILTHTTFSFGFTQNITESILFFIADKLTWLFAPLGLNSTGIVSSLFVGIMAKELIVSTMSICNNTSSTIALQQSLLLSTSVVNFSFASAVSFLIFSLLYCPCISNLAVIKKETESFFMWFSVLSQFTIAYMLSFFVYQSLTKGFAFGIISCFVVALIFFAIVLLTKKIKHPKCLTCNKCKN